MNKNNDRLYPLAVVFFLSGIWDTIAGMLYFFSIGTGRIIDQPPAHKFYMIFLGSFFICFAFLQFMSSRNIRKYAFNVGCLFIGRIFYVIQLYSFMIWSEDFPATFWFTGIIDGLFAFSYILLAKSGGISFKDLFWPEGTKISAGHS